MTNDPIDAHLEKMESVVMDVCTDKDKSQMKPERKPQKMLEREPEKAEIKSRPYIKVVLAGIFFLSLCANVGSLASSLASKETCVTGEGLLTEGQEVPALKTTERRRLDADDYYPGTVCACTQPPPVLKKCAVAPSGTEPCWELADPGMTDIPDNFLQYNTDITGTLKLGAAVKTIGSNAFRNTNLEGLDLSDAASLVSIGYNAFEQTNLEGTLVIPANVKTILRNAFVGTKLTGLDLSQAASLAWIGVYAFAYTGITGPIETLFSVPTYTTGGEASFPSGVWIVKVPNELADPTTAEPSPSPSPFE